MSEQELDPVYIEMKLTLEHLKNLFQNGGVDVRWDIGPLAFIMEMRLDKSIKLPEVFSVVAEAMTNATKDRDKDTQDGAGINWE